MGAMTLLEFKRSVGEREEELDLWIAYCAFHLGDYKRAMEEYSSLSLKEGSHPDVWVGLSCVVLCCVVLYCRSTAPCL
ncbi:UNVERIFIED_CONTAM: hypothetical protein FKN15_042286 [Acipenser sinensis]